MKAKTIEEIKGYKYMTINDILIYVIAAGVIAFPLWIALLPVRK